jgi:ornithine racemase
MMDYPALWIDLKKLEHNTRVLVDMYNKNNIGIAAVTKAYCAMPEIAVAQVRGGCSYLADSRVQNLKKLKDLSVPKMLIRIPMISQAHDVVKYADISLNSEYNTIRALSEAAVSLNKQHSVVLMVDVGDLREGYWQYEIMDWLDKVRSLPNIILKGIGTNYSCFGGVLPDEKSMKMLIDICTSIEEKYNHKLELISPGSSSVHFYFEKGILPQKVNNFRMGELILLGFDSQMDKYVDNTYKDVFVLEAEIIEIKTKPSVPIGPLGIDAFGQKPVFEDKGMMKRAILGIGRQDVKIETLLPLDENIEILGGSSDHTIVDISRSKIDYCIGSTMKFLPRYSALLSLSTSEYVSKKLIE